MQWSEPRRGFRTPTPSRPTMALIWEKINGRGGPGVPTDERAAPLPKNPERWRSGLMSRGWSDWWDRLAKGRHRHSAIVVRSRRHRNAREGLLEDGAHVRYSEDFGSERLRPRIPRGS